MTKINYSTNTAVYGNMATLVQIQDTIDEFEHRLSWVPYLCKVTTHGIITETVKGVLDTYKSYFPASSVVQVKMLDAQHFILQSDRVLLVCKNLAYHSP